MKTQMLSALSLALFLSAAPVWAQDGAGTSSARLGEAIDAQRLSDLGMAVNPQLGISSFEYSKRGAGDARTRLSGGVTAEFGGAARKLETGLLLLQSGSRAVLADGSEAEINASYLTIPMLAKLRVFATRAQSWYAKLGFMPAFEVTDSPANGIDVLGVAGLGGRLYFNRTTDFLLEASYNRGLIDALRTAGAAYNQGFVVMAGMSFRL